VAECAAIHGQSSPKQMADPAVAALGSGFVSDTARVNDNIQSLRPSLNEIIDSYIPNRIPAEHKEKDIVICVTFGGDVQEHLTLSISLFGRCIDVLAWLNRQQPFPTEANGADWVRDAAETISAFGEGVDAALVYVQRNSLNLYPKRTMVDEPVDVPIAENDVSAEVTITGTPQGESGLKSEPQLG
jgi:hypothetical protein